MWVLVCFPASSFVCLFGVLGAFVVYWSLCSGTGDDPWFGRPCRMNTSLHPVGWSGEDMPPFSRVPTAQLQALRLNLFLSLVCPGLLGSIVLFLPPSCMWSIRLAILYGFFCCFVVKEALGYFVELVVGPSLRAASLANLSASSLQWIPTGALSYENIIFHSGFSRLATFFLVSSTRSAWLLGLWSESRETRLSVNIIALRGLIVCLFIDSIASRAFSMASCSAWLLEHLSSSFSFNLAAISLALKIATPDPTPWSSCFHRCTPWLLFSRCLLLHLLL